MSKTLILLWGWTSTDQTYQTILSSAPPGWKVYPLNYQQLIPHGNIKNLNNSILKFIKDHNIQEFSLMGHSVGGALAVNFASVHPANLQHLYLIDSTGLPNLKSLFSWFKNFPKLQSSEPHPINRILEHPILHLRLAIFSIFGNLTNSLSLISVPTTILWGQKDEVVPVSIGQRIQSLIPNSNLKILKNYTHDWVKEHPELFWQNL